MDKFLIVGLGNPEEKYKNTRHNIGFEILDFICKKNESKFETNRLGELAGLLMRHDCRNHPASRSACGCR